jgi:hypothetical protein
LNIGGTMASSAHWLSRERVTNYPKILFLGFLVIGSVLTFTTEYMVDSKGRPIGHDFIAFWAASYLGLTGHPYDAYDFSLLFGAEQIAIPAARYVYPWYYPPSFYLLILPLALLPYLTAYFAFMVSTLGSYLFVLRRIIHGNVAMWCLAGFSGLWVNIFHGQNAFLTASLAGAGLLCMRHKPVCAGVCIGLLIIKPHLAILFPIALIATGAWRTFAVAAATASAFLGISMAVLGMSTLKASLGSLHYARLFLEEGMLPWSKMPTVFSFLRLLGVPVGWSYSFHGVIALGAGVIVWRVWRRCLDWNIRGATLMTATFLISPYVFDYDLAWLAFPIAWMVVTGLRDGWLLWEREVLVGAWLLPLLMVPIGNSLNLQLGPFVLVGLLWITARRAGTVPGKDAVFYDKPACHPGAEASVISRSCEMQR